MAHMFLYGLSLSLLFGPIAATLISSGMNSDKRESILSATAVATADIFIFSACFYFYSLATIKINTQLELAALYTFTFLANLYIAYFGIMTLKQSFILDVRSSKLGWPSIFVATIINPGTTITTLSVVASTSHNISPGNFISYIVYYFLGTITGQALYVSIGIIISSNKSSFGYLIHRAISIAAGLYLLGSAASGIFNTSTILHRL